MLIEPSAGDLAAGPLQPAQHSMEALATRVLEARAAATMQALLNSSAYELEQAATQQRNQHDERLGKPMFPPRVTAAEPSLADTQSDISAAALAIQVVARDACAGDAATSGSLSQKFLEECRNHLQVSPIGDANVCH